MKSRKRSNRPDRRLAAAAVYAIVSLPICALATFVLMYFFGSVAQDPNHRGYSTRLQLAEDWFERIDWTSAIFLFVIVYIVFQVIANWNLIKDPPEHWFGGTRGNKSLSIAEEESDDDSRPENK
ncbi:MAG TPA: hypothetical protein PKA82_13575 [Pyrinomonadaceae bacterium]|nr:hypothetical protein [Pyrinomonadaceae bacterium]